MKIDAPADLAAPAVEPDTPRHLRRALLAGLAGAAAAATLAPSVARAQAPTGESTFDRILRTKTIRVAGLNGELPFFSKKLDTGEWYGACVEMVKDIAKQLGGMNVEYVDSTYGNSVLQIQAGQVDVGFALNATPVRALSIDFTRPVFNHGYGMVGKPEFVGAHKTWSDLNRPEVKIAVDLGSAQETAARRFAPKATITALKNRDEVVLALASGRAECTIMAALVGMTAAKKNAAIGKFAMLSNPVVSLPSNIGVRKDPDRKWRDFLDVWIEFNRGTGQIREWMIGGMSGLGITAEDVPAEVTF
jgi:polar amino acid transport system substrate-binding protein